jgi:single-stranded DNA-binding protein
MSNNNSQNGKPRFSNFVILTVQAASDGETRYAANGKLWGSVRTFLSQGKDEGSDKFKPSIWFTVKGFTTKDGNQSVPEFIQTVSKGQKITVKGRLGLEQWTDSAGNTRQTLVIFASHIEPVVAHSEAADLNGEP